MSALEPPLANQPEQSEQPGLSGQLDTCATQPLGRALRLLGDAPTLLIIVTLLRGTRRFGEIRLALDGVSPKTVAQRLKLLEGLGFLRRHAYAEIPPRVEYDLTEKGRALADIVAAIEAFGARYLAAGLDAAPTASEESGMRADR